MKALRACLAEPSADYKLSLAERVSPFDWNQRLVRDPDGYASTSAQLGYGLHHMVLVSRKRGFMAVLSEQSVWLELLTERFSTPIVRAWSKYLYDHLLANWSLLERPSAFGCQPGILKADDESLDKIVAAGLRSGKLSI